MPQIRTVIVVVALLLAVPLVAAAIEVGPAARPALDGNPATTERLDQGDPIAASVAASGLRFTAVDGDRPARHAVLARVDDFADSLAGAALSAEGPLLLTPPDRLDEAVRAELDRVLDAGGTVYVLGGEQALGAAVVDALAGYDVRRLAGESRVETALAVADEVLALGGDRASVLLARSNGTATNPTSAWADSVPAGALAAAAGVPILVTPSDALHAAVAAWMADHATTETILLGGQRALSDAVAAAVPGARRVAGPERTATAAEIAVQLWGAASRGSRAFVMVDGARADGYAYGLVAAGLAADSAVPALMVTDRVSAATRRLVSTCGVPEVDLLIVGDESVISEQIADELDGLDRDACSPADAALRGFTDCQQTLEHLIAEGLEQVGPYGLDGHYYGGPMPVDGDVVAVSPTPEPAPAAPAEEDAGGESADGGSTGGGDDFSSTNVQEAGVDEPDITKTDGQALFTARYSGVEVTGLGADGPTPLASIDLPDDGYGHELLLADDILVILSRGSYASDGSQDGAPPEDTAFAPDYYYPNPVTVIARYDVSDPAQPVLLDRAELDGEYRSARLIGTTARVVLSANPTGLDFVFPEDSSQEAHDRAEAHNRAEVANSTIADWIPQLRSGGTEVPLVDCADLYAPAAYSGVSTVAVVGFDVGQGVQPTSSAGVIAHGETVYASLERLVVSANRWGAWVDDRPPAEAVTTELHSFDISNPNDVAYVASGQVPGYVLNQFALSARNGYLRVATTSEPTFAEGEASSSSSQLIVLAEGGSQLFEVGRVSGLGEGERIYAVRYLGDDLAAVVTFRQIDPLYLISLTNPEAPRVLGELKVNGYSSYLHPIGDDQLLGVGQDADDQGFVTGLQVQLFDIADLSNPQRVDQIVFGQGWSEVEYDHRAFLYWQPTSRAFVPYETYEENSFDSGVAAIDVGHGTLTDAARLRQEQAGDSYLGIPRRTIVVGERVYTVSEAGVASYDLATSTPQGWAPFPQAEEPCCYVEPVPAEPA